MAGIHPRRRRRRKKKGLLSGKPVAPPTPDVFAALRKRLADINQKVGHAELR